ncbi:MAG: hypothetical protein K0R34_2792 [Herbinix sp.]|jgi:hypothetical protein|nr:hypothetical protein [Herbinix sp.]
MTALQRLWKDRMDIYRFKEETVNNTTTNVKQIISTGIRCHYSKGSLTNAGEEGVPTLINTYSIFCALETDLREGDEVVVTQRNGRQVTLSVGECFPYSAHQEFRVKRSETA